MKIRKTICLLLAICMVILIAPVTPALAVNPVFRRDMVPEPIFDQNAGYVELYWRTWEIAANQVVFDENAAYSPYMDEVCYDNVVWIWDSCFMTMFNKYASTEYFPGINNLHNFYLPLYDNVSSSQSIWFADNPNLFAWVEWQSYLMTGDTERVKWLINDGKYLQKHYQMMETATPGVNMPNSSHPVAHKREELGYTGSNQIVGMDNSPRGRTYGENNILWVDTIAQQALSAYYISQLAEVAGNQSVMSTYSGYYASLKTIVNQYYWDQTDGLYYDINKTTSGLKDKVKTIASFWPMLAMIPNAAQAEALKDNAINPQVFGGFVSFPSVARNDTDFDGDTGAYWRGGLWVPTAYMGVKSLENYGYIEEADAAALSILEQQYQTYKNYSPSTIWETYAPNSNEPSTEYGNIVRQDFCGWSALGPISMFIENILGFHLIDGVNNRIEWRMHNEQRNGIKNLTFGEINTDIVYANGVITVQSNSAYTLEVNGVENQIIAGLQSFDMQGNVVEVPSPPPFDPTPTQSPRVNIATGKTASASSIQGAFNSANMGNDGNQRTMWIAANGDAGNWWQIDLGEAYTITDGELLFENSDNAWKYRIEASADATNWTTIVDKTANTSTVQLQSFDVDVIAQYLRVTVTENPANCWTAFRELRLFGEVGGGGTPEPPVPEQNLALNKSATASSTENTSRSAVQAVDGNSETMWIAANGGENWWQVDLERASTVSRVIIKFEEDTAVWKYKVETSLDGETWVMGADRTNNENDASEQIAAFAIEAQYVRITITEPAFDCWPALCEVQVMGI